MLTFLYVISNTSYTIGNTLTIFMVNIFVIIYIMVVICFFILQFAKKMAIYSGGQTFCYRIFVNWLRGFFPFKFS